MLVNIKKISISFLTLVITFNTVFSYFVPIVGFADDVENSNYTKDVNLKTSEEEEDEQNQQYDVEQLFK